MSDKEEITIEQVIHRKERAHRNIFFAQLCAFLLMVGVTIYVVSGFGARDQAICDTSADNRQAVRNLVVAIDDLGRDLVIGNGDPNSPTPEQQATLDQFEQFKEQQLKLLKDDVC